MWRVEGMDEQIPPFLNVVDVLNFEDHFPFQTVVTSCISNTSLLAYEATFMVIFHYFSLVDPTCTLYIGLIDEGMISMSTNKSHPSGSEEGKKRYDMSQ